MKDINTLQDHINKTAKAAAETEWQEFEKMVADWFAARPSGYARLIQNAREHAAGAASNAPLDAGLKTLAAEFLTERTKAHAERITAELLEKLAVLPT
jgi:hypothetical protein